MELPLDNSELPTGSWMSPEKGVKEMTHVRLVLLTHPLSWSLRDTGQFVTVTPVWPPRVELFP